MVPAEKCVPSSDFKTKLICRSATDQLRFILSMLLLLLLASLTSASVKYVSNDTVGNKGCTAGYVHLYNACYHFSTHNATQDGAAVMCEEWGAKLLTVEGYDENVAIKAYLPKISSGLYWTSLRLDMDSCVWRWDLGSGDHITYSDWCPPSVHENCIVEPDPGDDGGHYFAIPDFKYTWGGRVKTEMRQYICKAPLTI